MNQLGDNEKKKDEVGIYISENRLATVEKELDMAVRI